MLVYDYVFCLDRCRHATMQKRILENPITSTFFQNTFATDIE